MLVRVLLAFALFFLSLLTLPVISNANPTAQIDSSALKTLVERARATHTDALVVMKNGRLVGSWEFGHPDQPIFLMAVAKSICALAVGALVDDGRLRLDEPVADFIPQWRNDAHTEITVRQLLSMTTGLADPAAAEFRLDRDLERLAIEEPLVERPGTRWRYNNTSVNLVDAVVHRVTGKPLDSFLQERIFAPLGIQAYWQPDAAGNVPCAAGLSLRPIELARIGDVIANDGVASGRRLLSRQTIDLLTRPSQNLEPRFGLLWWVVYSRGERVIDPATFERWKAAGVKPALLAKVRPMVGVAYPDEAFNDRLRHAMTPYRIEDLDLELQRTHSPWERFVPRGSPCATWALGAKGQKLYVSRGERLVVVRLIRPEHWRGSADDFFDFLHLVKGLTPGAAVAGGG